MSSYERQCDTFIFKDKSVLDTMVYLTIGGVSRIKREGKIKMDFYFDLENSTQGIYENDIGLSAIFTINTKEMYFENNVFVLAYELFIDGDKLSDHFIRIKFI